MPWTRRSVLSAVPLAALTGTASIGRWASGVCDSHPVAFGVWRGTPVTIIGLFGDNSPEAQLEQWQFCHVSGFSGDVDLAVGGPIGTTWAEVAAGSQVAAWKQTAAALRRGWHYRTVYLRFAHEFNGQWMPWSVAPSDVAAFRQAFRLFAVTMRRELAGRRVKIVWAPNYGTWYYQPDAAWPGADVVDVIGVSLYDWAPYDTQQKWKTFLASPIGPNAWSAFAARHGRPMAFSEWGAQSTLFLRGMRAWMAGRAGTRPGQLLYDVYLNGNELLLQGATAAQYRALRWGRP